MSSATTTTGRHGKLWAAATGTVLNATHNILRTTQWSVSQKPASVSEWGDSSSLGYTNRAPGRRDVTFTAEGKFDKDQQQWDIFQGGDYCAANLYVNSNEDVTWAYTFARALCMEFSLAVNIDTEEVVGWTSSWGNDGVFTLPGGDPGDELPE